MFIRKYCDTECLQVEKICSADNGPMGQAIVQCFCRYYLDQEPENCFVCADDGGKIYGYVLCATDFSRWEQAMRASYMKNDPISLAMGNATIENLRPFSAAYPAHLHIDLLPEAQGQGQGTKLMQALIAHLRANGISGLMLDVAAENIAAQHFYQKNGFAFLGGDDHSLRMGIVL